MSNQLPGTPTSQRWACGMIIGSLGLVTGLAHLDHLIEDAHRFPVVSGILFPLGLSMGLLCAGYWLVKSDYGGEQAVSIAIWSIIGAVVLTLSGVVVQHSVLVTGDAKVIIVLPSSVTEGTAVGFVYGVYAIWSDE
ncbi:hypothetical protein [Halocatena pleomorpha]|uniref:Archaeal histidine kinase 4TM domain-containing protein n=1 Tax=Halocatena pleomorpha TaxID=1785090 RepID=A0A3P3RGU2_9EURY|nr:hypothetical protein [Halocatena pleomorpha]RRJ32158.1 hypothetical protein EIK79_05145 [Halocatena pleomorpha]